MEPYFTPTIKGHDRMSCPSFAFLITHPTLKRNILYDLGIRKDWTNLSPRVVAALQSNGWDITVEKNVSEILTENNVPLSSIEAIIWSHHHWDHTGDPSQFPPSTSLVVGPGFKSEFLPGYPSKATSSILESDYHARELIELAFTDLKIGNFAAHDYFGDGSLFLLDAPGHTIGHICALARVTSNPNTYIFMGGDACHHNGEFRPSAYLPLPESIFPNPFYGLSATSSNPAPPCPGSLVQHLLPSSAVTKPFYYLKRDEKGEAGMANDVDEAERTIAKVQEADGATEEVLVVMAHDDSLLDVVDFFPKEAGAFGSKGWVGMGRWAFLKDFKDAVEGA